MANIAQTLSQARASGIDRLDADLMLLFALGHAATELHAGRAWLLSHDTDPVAADIARLFEQFVARRRCGEPLAYITGHKEFFGLDLLVDHRVLVPRPDTETLVTWALQMLPRSAASPSGLVRMLDLGTGSGAIALALKHERPDLAVDGVDASQDALTVAMSNSRRLGLQVQWLHGSWYGPTTRRYHCIVANPPYVEMEDPHLADLRHEPIGALASGPDGLADIRSIVAGAGQHLLPGAWLLLEHGFEQGPAVRALLQHAGLLEVSAREDLAGHWRCSGGRWPG